MSEKINTEENDKMSAVEMDALKSDVIKLEEDLYVFLGERSIPPIVAVNGLGNAMVTAIIKCKFSEEDEASIFKNIQTVYYDEKARIFDEEKKSQE